MKILHVLRVTKARAVALAELATSLSISDREVHYITLAGRSLLTPLPEALPNPESEGFCSGEMAIEPIED